MEPRSPSSLIAAATAAAIALGLVPPLVLAAPPAPDCVRVEIPEFRVVPDLECRFATHPAARQHLADLAADAATPAPNGPCYTIGPTAVRFTDGAGRTTEAVATTVSAETVGVAGARVAPLPIPLFDAAGSVRILTPFSAATVMDVTSSSGRQLGQLVLRDAGWAEIDPVRNFPSFLTDRLMVTHAAGKLLRDVTGEIIVNGDAFVAGAPAVGTLCGGQLSGRLQRHAR